MKVETMTDYVPTANDHYRRYAELLRRHNQLLSEGTAEGELDSVEDEMTQIWNDLDLVQRKSLSGLSSDLTWLRRGGRSAPKAKPATEVTADDLRELSQARDSHDWHKLLHYLRLCSAQLSPFEVAFLRATAWQALDFPQLARTFSGLAARLEPNNASLAVLPLPLEPETTARDHAPTID